MTQSPTLLARLLIGGIRLYQWILSPLVGGHCRFQPTCSRYAAEAIQKHGGFKGGLMGIKRLARCHPWGGAGWDPVPKDRDS
ncbi:MAG: membrane protein insertion efficiency factor YidD [Planctomycetes bacterium]|jgi:putative membrane protein insertion efficiency factor|nr:membrane protein insertion efficiency factor YidD [Planctomycetota bacterium]MCP4839878.1 membrane protein insertion efficiency factor YidD [Planctomycetota bacterium]